MKTGTKTCLPNPMIRNYKLAQKSGRQQTQKRKPRMRAVQRLGGTTFSDSLAGSRRSEWQAAQMHHFEGIFRAPFDGNFLSSVIGMHRMNLAPARGKHSLCRHFQGTNLHLENCAAQKGKLIQHRVHRPAPAYYTKALVGLTPESNSQETDAMKDADVKDADVQVTVFQNLPASLFFFSRLLPLVALTPHRNE